MRQVILRGLSQTHRHVTSMALALIDDGFSDEDFAPGSAPLIFISASVRHPLAVSRLWWSNQLIKMMPPNATDGEP